MRRAWTALRRAGRLPPNPLLGLEPRGDVAFFAQKAISE